MVINMDKFKNQLIIMRHELLESGYSSYIIKKNETSNKIKKLNNQAYENLSYNGDLNDYYYVKAYATKGVVGLMSAATYYGFTTFRNSTIDVVIHRAMKVSTLPMWPTIKVYYFEKKRYELGILHIKENKNDFYIYDKEKTVCDVVRYRNTFGIDIMIEVLKNYLGDSNRDINKLITYAKELKAFHTLKPYLEGLLS